MAANRMIPMIWIRLVILLGFAVFTGYQGMWWIAAIALGLAVLSGWQLASAYREKRETEET